MSPRARALIGILTTFFFAVSGGLLVAEQRSLGWVLLGLALLRGFFAVVQIRALTRPPAENP